MTLRSAAVVLLAVIVMIFAIEVSTWALGRAMSVVVPSASVSDLDAPVPQASEVEAPPPTSTPAFTW